MKKRRTAIGSSRIVWWTQKIHILGARSFGPSASHWAIHTLERLSEKSDGFIESRNLETACTALRVPRKFISRSLALLTRSGLITLVSLDPVRILLHPDRLARHKNSAQKLRNRIPRGFRDRLISQDKFMCGHCAIELAPDQLEIDHIIPLSLLGADEPGNWVALCSKHNRYKSHHFNPTFIRFYRGRRVRKLGVRFKNGFFWPHINGTTKIVTRERWRATGLAT